MGMFGIDPEELALLQQQQDSQKAMQAAQLPLGSGGVYASSIAGNMLGRGIAGALGYQDPRMEQAMKIKKAMEDTNASGIDYAKDPIGYMSVGARNLMSAGLYEQAMAMNDKIAEAKKGKLAEAQIQHLGLQNRQIESELNAPQKMQAAWEEAFGNGGNTGFGGASGSDTNAVEVKAKRLPTTLNSENWFKFSAALLNRGLAKEAEQAAQKGVAIEGMNDVKFQQVGNELIGTNKRGEEVTRIKGDGTASNAHTTQAERSMATLRNLQLQVDGGKPLTKEQQLEAESARNLLEQQRPVIDPISGKLMLSQPIEVPKGITVGGASKQRGNVLPSLSGGRKPLDAGTEKKFTDIGSGLSQIDRFTNDFKPEFGGFVSETVAEGAIQAGRRGIIPKYEGMANFWQEYRQWLTDMRAAKFGMTLTGYELQAFKQYTSNPGDSPDIIKRNMTRQLEIIHKAADRELKALDVSGQNVKQGEALSGKQLDEPIVRPVNTNPDLGKPAYTMPQQTPSGAGGGQIKTWEDGGYIFRQLPDGTVQRKKK